MECPLSYTQAHNKAISRKYDFLPGKEVQYSLFHILLQNFKRLFNSPMVGKYVSERHNLNKFSFH